MRFAVILAATATTFLSAPAMAQRSAPYRALGTEPGWTLTIDNRQMRYEGDYGRTRLTVPTPRVQNLRGVRRYAARGLTVEITDRECSDGMSDRRYAETVKVTTRGRTVHGCGGAVWELPELTGQRWRIQKIGNVFQQPGMAQSAMQFTADRVSATPGCNNFTGSYRIVRGQLVAGPMAGTRKMCAPDLMRRDTEFAAILRQPLTITTPQEGMVVLAARDGRQIVLRRFRGVR